MSRGAAVSTCQAENGASLAHLRNANDLAALAYFYDQSGANIWIGLEKITSGTSDELTVKTLNQVVLTFV